MTAEIMAGGVEMSEREPPDVGGKVQARREQLGLSMRGLAEQCGLSPNTISLIERGATSPNVSTLHQLATALRVPITAFFQEPGEGVRVIHTRPGERSFSGSASALLESLGLGLVGQSLEPFLVTLQPGADSGPGAMSHGGHELVYCLTGVVEYVIEEQRYRLDAGDSLLFEAHLRHCWRNPGSEPGVFLLIFQADEPGEHVEQHLRR
jgi:transcriptional regulator with XRE-family HTH domain